MAFRKGTSAASMKRTLRQLSNQRIHERDRTCQAMGLWSINCWGPLQVCHFHPRRHMTVTYDPENLALMCAAHHTYFDGHGDIKWRWIEERLGTESVDALRARRDQRWGGRADYDRWLEALRG